MSSRLLLTCACGAVTRATKAQETQLLSLIQDAALTSVERSSSGSKTGSTIRHCRDKMEIMVLTLFRIGKIFADETLGLSEDLVSSRMLKNYTPRCRTCARFDSENRGHADI